jgi:hypothetical protein
VTAPYRTREVSRFWLVHIVTAIVATIIAFAITTAFHGSSTMALAIGLGIVAGVVILDIARCRTIAIDREGFFVAKQHYAWTDVEHIKVRAVPIARAGIYVKLTDKARRTPPRYNYLMYDAELDTECVVTTATICGACQRE